MYKLPLMLEYKINMFIIVAGEYNLVHDLLTMLEICELETLLVV